MPTPQFPAVSDDATLEDVKNAYIGISRYLTYLLSALDTLNVSRLDAKVIIAESITAGKLAADSVSTDNLQAGAVTADKITVNELSAITANLGHITAGLVEAVQIFGSYIATANGTFPRVEISSDENLFAAYLNSGDAVKIVPIYLGGSPAFTFDISGSVRGILSLLSTALSLSTSGTTDISLSAANDILLACDDLKINNETGWSGSYNDGINEITVTNGIITDVS